MHFLSASNGLSCWTAAWLCAPEKADSCVQRRWIEEHRINSSFGGCNLPAKFAHVDERTLIIPDFPGSGCKEATPAHSGWVHSRKGRSCVQLRSFPKNWRICQKDCPDLSSDFMKTLLVPGNMLTANCSAHGAKLCKCLIQPYIPAFEERGPEQSLSYRMCLSGRGKDRE